MANRAQSIANNVEKMSAHAKPPESSGKEKLTPLPPELKGVQQLTPQQPPKSSVAEQLTQQQAPESSVAEQLTPQHPSESSGAEQQTPQHPSESSAAEQQPAPPKEKKGPPGGKKAKSKKNKQQKQNASAEKQPTTSLEGEQTFSKPVLAKSKMHPEENLLTNKEQAASTSKEIQVAKQQNREEDKKQPTTQSNKKMSKTKSEKKQSASPSEGREATKEHETEEEHAALSPKLEDWTDLLEEKEPVNSTVGEQTTEVSKGKQMIILAEANQQRRQTEEKQCSEPKRKNGKKRPAMKSTGRQPTTQPAKKQPKVVTEAQQATTLTEAQQIMLSDEEMMTALSQSLSLCLSKAQPTSGEVEELFWQVLTKGFPLHFSTENVRAIRRNGQMRITNPHVLVLGCPEDTSYDGLFGSHTEEEGYKSGPIVNTVDAMVPFLKKENINAIKKAKEYLSETYMIRSGELREKSPSYKTHLYMVTVVKGTLMYFNELVQWLSLTDADPWVPLGQRRNATH